MSGKKLIYLAGPKGFSEAGKYWFYNKVIPLLEPHYDLINPWKFMSASELKRLKAMSPGDARFEGWSNLNTHAFDDGIDAILKCDGILADLDGVDVDSGTAFEMGYAFSAEKKIVGYRGDWRNVGDNEALVVNLMIDRAVIRRGGPIVRTIDDVLPAMQKYIGL